MTTIPITQRHLTTTLVIGCILLLQWHSLLFWVDVAGLGAAGVVWSLLLEGCALWMWMLRD